MEGNSLVSSDTWSEKRQYHNYQQHQNPQQQYQQDAQHWMTPEISAQVQACNQLRKTAEATGKQEDHEAYQAQCRKVHRMIEESKLNLGLGQLPALPQGYGYGWHQQSGYGYNNYYQRGSRENSNFQHPMGNQYQKKQFTCKPCNRSYFSQRKLDEHIQEHVECPFPECKMSAHAKIIDQHINNQHMLVNFAQLQIDDETWVADRKKRFPSTQRAELRRAEQMEKLKRGETLGITKKPFKSKIKSIVSNNDGREETKRCNTVNKKENKGKISNVDNEKGHDINPEGSKVENNSNVIVGEQEKGENREFKGKRDRRERFKRQRQQHSLITLPPVEVVEVDLFESDSEQRDGLCAFKGTKSFYEEIGEVSYFGNNNIDESEDEDNDQEEKIAISDDEEWEVEKQTESSGGPLLGGALGSLMGAYSDSEEENMDESPKQEKDKPESVLKPCTENALQKVTVDAAQDVGKEDSQQNSESVPRTRTRKRMPRKVKGPNKGPPKPRRAPRRRKTLLERLLQADIIHERNVILQCVRFIVGTNFLTEERSKDIQPENEKVETDSKCVVDSLEKVEDKPTCKNNLEVMQDVKQQDRQENDNLQNKATQDGRWQDRKENDKLQCEVTQDGIHQDRQESWRSKSMLNNKDMKNKKAAKRLKKELLAGDGNYKKDPEKDNNKDCDMENCHVKSTKQELNADTCNTVIDQKIGNSTTSEKESSDRDHANIVSSKEKCKENEDNCNVEKIGNLEKDDKSGISEEMTHSSALKRKESENINSEECEKLSDEVIVKKIKVNDTEEHSNGNYKKDLEKDEKEREMADSDMENCHVKSMKQELNGDTCNTAIEKEISNSTTSERESSDCNDVEKFGNLGGDGKSGISEELPHSSALKRKESINSNSDECERQSDEVIVKKIKLNDTEEHSEGGEMQQ